MRYPRVIDLPLSLRPVWLIAAIHLVAAIAFAHLGAQPGWLAAGMAALAASSFASLRAWRARHGQSLVLGDDGGLVVRRDGRECEVRLAAAVTDFGWAVWILWREPGPRRPCAAMLLRADFAPEDWHALGLWLRHKAVVGEGLLSVA